MERNGMKMHLKMCKMDLNIGIMCRKENFPPFYWLKKKAAPFNTMSNSCEELAVDFLLWRIGSRIQKCFGWQQIVMMQKTQKTPSWWNDWLSSACQLLTFNTHWAYLPSIWSRWHRGKTILGNYPLCYCTDGYVGDSWLVAFDGFWCRWLLNNICHVKPDMKLLW